MTLSEYIISHMVSCFSDVFRETLLTYFVPDKSHKRISGGLKDPPPKLFKHEFWRIEKTNTSKFVKETISFWKMKTKENWIFNWYSIRLSNDFCQDQTRQNLFKSLLASEIERKVKQISN